MSTSHDSDVRPQQWLELARAKLERVVGHARAPALVDEILRELQLDNLESPEQLALFGEHLARRGGFLSPLGASLKTQALLHRTRANL